MAQYQKYPSLIEAFKYGEHLKPDWFLDAVKDGKIIEKSGFCLIKIPEGNLTAKVGDYIIKGTIEIYPCIAAVFEKIYAELTPYG